MINAGSKKGFVPNAEKIYINKSINSKMFEDWIKDNLLPNLPRDKTCVVIIDNCATHSRISNPHPKECEPKQKLINWLKNNNIPFDNKSNKKQLFKLIKDNAPPTEYVVDKMIEAAGHLILRLPPYGADLNPIELIWAKWKQLVGKFNFRKNKPSFIRLMRNSFNKIKENFWAKMVRRTDKIAGDYWIKDGIIDNPNYDHHYHLLNV